MPLTDIKHWTKTVKTYDEHGEWETCLPDPAQEMRSLYENAISSDDFETKEDLRDAFLDMIEGMTRDAAIGVRGLQSSEANLLQDIFL